MDWPLLRRLPALLGLALAASASAGETPDAVVALEVFPAPLPGQLPEAAPPRFALMQDGTVYVGGSSGLASARLEKREVKAIEKQVARVRKLPGLGSSVTLGPGAKRYRLALRKGPTIAAAGDAAQAPPGLKPLAELLTALEAFDHPELRPYRAAQYALLVQPGTLAGGCRPWSFGAPPVAGPPPTVSADAAADWPTGLTAASVCVGDKTYVVGLRPLLPGERP